MSNPTSIQCDDTGYSVKIHISVVDEKGDPQATVDYVSPEATFGFAMASMNSDIALLSAAWGKAIAKHCPSDDNAIASSVAAEASD